MLNNLRFSYKLIASLILFIPDLYADNFRYNSYNNHGVLGLINTPIARIYDEGSFGVTIYDGTPDQKITITSSPYKWLEASFFYTNIQGRPYGNGFNQDYKDKGFNVKVKLKDEGVFPALAVGINDIAGTGFYSSEFIVASYGIDNIDFHFGLGWGTLNGSDNKIKNPFSFIHDSFTNRPDNPQVGIGGQFQPSRYFSSKDVSPFYGLSYILNNKLLFKIENDTTETPGDLEYKIPSNRVSFGFEYAFNKNFTVGISKERDDYLSLKFIYKQEAASSSSKYKYKKIKKEEDHKKYDHLIKSLESNGVGVNKIIEGAETIGLELTQFSHPNLDIVEDILFSAVRDSGITKQVKTDYRIADLQAVSNFSDDLDEDNAKIIYKRKQARNFSTSNKLSIRPFLASREGFFRFSLLGENNSEYIIKDNFFFSSNIKYSIYDNFDDLKFPPVDTYPAQVRSDIKDYLRNMNHPIIGRAQFDYHITPMKNNHVMFTAGILEEMFSGYGLEYLYFDNRKDYAVGFELFNVQKRDYEMQFGKLDYKNTTGSINFYYRNYGLIPFDAKISYGEYLAGDIGATFEVSRSYINGAKFGVFASFTDVTSEQFGEGSFDKGIFFSIPIYKNLLDYTWRPLTKDPGAKLNRKHTLHDLLVKFKPYNH